MTIPRALSSIAHRPYDPPGGWHTKRHSATWSCGQWKGSQVTVCHAIPAERCKCTPCQFGAYARWRSCCAARPGQFSGSMEGGSWCHFLAAQCISRGNKPEDASRERSSEAADHQKWEAWTRALARSGGLERAFDGGSTTLTEPGTWPEAPAGSAAGSVRQKNGVRKGGD